MAFFKLGQRAWFGTRGDAVATLLAKHGEEAAWLATRRTGLKLAAEHGHDAARALIKHKGVAEPLIAEFQTPAARALIAMEGRNARRLAMLAQDGSLTKADKGREIFNVLERYGDRAMEFLWRHKGVLAGGALLIAFLENPEPYLAGTVKLAETAAGVVKEPLTAGAKEAGRSVNGTVPILVIGAFAGTLVLWRLSRGCRSPRGSAKRVS